MTGWHSAPRSPWPGTAGMEPVAFPVAGTARMAFPPARCGGRDG